ncbi:ATP-dependent RNA helicase [Galdieria sulphuraria]|uniref:ATP-dependent RNA helicase n=1 Tax=Galdieria sulphuraria TaxID=130081 RepID=M2XU82_GALSU|nr:ATP-dependent RNA helicase [Galdieria sulphuraria]EME26964.1 ATP-dependent RNA helicase [Galdieria sulphuraria]|eukprot:XP_005703484.1 ATP-dependent RNA helicase [Galdieria sulphuraria]
MNRSLFTPTLRWSQWFAKTCTTLQRRSVTTNIWKNDIYLSLGKCRTTTVGSSSFYLKFYGASSSYSTLSVSSVDDDSSALHYVDNLPIREETKERLKASGITRLFPVQQKCWNPIWQGKDVVVRSQTGTGKTLAYVLPLIEKASLGHFKAHTKRTGSPFIVVLAPTRELARQVFEEFGKLETTLLGACIYGGAPYRPQEEQLRNCLSFLVGTPGRVADMCRKNLLHLELVQCIVLDEADRMLEIGFASELEQILSAVSGNKQTLLFSATLPTWVKQQSAKNMRNPAFLDLVGEDKDAKIPKDVKHYAIEVPPFAKEAVIGDILSVFGGEKCIIFTPTKREADMLGSSEYIRDESTVIHGDIPQDGRELAINGFRKGKFRNLIATDVAARGIDIPNVDFVLMTYTPTPTPESIDMYVHRSGRTGRAGNKGKSMLIYSQAEKDKLLRLERALGIRFERLHPPSSEQLLMVSLERSWKKVLGTPDSLVSQVLPILEDKIKNIHHQQYNSVTNGSVLDAIMNETKLEKKLQILLGAALARLGGFHSTVQHRSLLTSKHGFATFHIQDNRPIAKRKGFGVHFLRRILSESLPDLVKDTEAISKVVVYPSGYEALFDVSEKVASSLVEYGLGEKSQFEVKPVKQLTQEMIQVVEAAEKRKLSVVHNKTQQIVSFNRH